MLNFRAKRFWSAIRPRIAFWTYEVEPAGTAQSTCDGTIALPSLPAHEIDTGFRRRNRERCHDHWAGSRP